MRKPSRELQAAISRLHGRRGVRWPRWVRDGVVTYANARRSAGLGWGRVARELGMHSQTVRRFVLASDESTVRALAPVEVVHVAATVPSQSPSPFVVVSPTGFRVEGLDVTTAATLLRALS